MRNSARSDALSSRNPKARTLLVLGYPDVYAAGDHAPEIMQHKPIGLEGIDHVLIGYMKKTGLHPEDIQLLPEGKGFLMAEFGGDSKEDADEKARAVMAALKKKGNAPNMKLFDEEWEESKVWEVRESGLGATAFVPGLDDTWPGWEDSAVPPDKVGPYLRDLRKLFHKYNYSASLYGHFGQGCIHCRIPFDLYTAAGIKKFRAFIDEASDLVLSYGGSLSGEHGDGQSRAELLPKMYGAEIMEAFREFKSIWDPQWKMNPGKVIGAYAITENLRIGSDYNPWEPPTYFQYPSDKGNFRAGDVALRGSGEMSAARRRHDVPKLHGHTRREGHDARPGTSLIRNVARRNHRQKRLARRECKGRARSLSRLQGLQERLPGQCGHGHLQGGISRSLL